MSGISSHQEYHCNKSSVYSPRQRNNTSIMTQRIWNTDQMNLGWRWTALSACLRKRGAPVLWLSSWSPLDTLQQLHVLLVLGAPELNSVLHVRSFESGVEGKHHLPQTSAQCCFRCSPEHELSEQIYLWNEHLTCCQWFKTAFWAACSMQSGWASTYQDF